MRTKFTFEITLWDETGNQLIEHQMFSVIRVNTNTAINFVKNKFKRPYFVELYSTKNLTTKNK